jgi:thiol:disulfide interchange protein DsbA
MLKRLIFIMLLIPFSCFADPFVAGKDYEIINSTAESPSSGKTSVIEFFSYGCPWCYRIEPSLSQWAKQHEKDVELKRIPVVFNKEWIYYAKAYYAADLLGLGAKFNPLLFKAIQTDKMQLTNNQAMIDFFISNGVNKETAESAFNNSTTVDMNVSEGNIIMGRMHINAVPAIVVNNLYKTDLQMAQGEERLFKILDYLLTKSLKQKS